MKYAMEMFFLSLFHTPGQRSDEKPDRLIACFLWWQVMRNSKNYD